MTEAEVYIRISEEEFLPVDFYDYSAVGMLLYVSHEERRVYNSWGQEVIPDEGKFRFKSPKGTFEGAFEGGKFVLRQRAVFGPNSNRDFK